MNQDKFAGREYHNAVRELHYYLNNPGSSFMCILFHLIERADTDNLTRIRAGFPYEVGAWEMWRDSDDQHLFFEKWLENRDGVA